MGTISREDVAAIVLHTLFFPKKMGVTFEVIETDQENEINWPEVFSALEPD